LPVQRSTPEDLVLAKAMAARIAKLSPASWKHTKTDIIAAAARDSTLRTPAIRILMLVANKIQTDRKINLPGFAVHGCSLEAMANHAGLTIKGAARFALTLRRAGYLIALVGNEVAALTGQTNGFAPNVYTLNLDHPAIACQK
jgi:hypothetical protein